MARKRGPRLTTISTRVDPRFPPSLSRRPLLPRNESVGVPRDISWTRWGWLAERLCSPLLLLLLLLLLLEDLRVSSLFACLPLYTPSYLSRLKATERIEVF